MSDIISRSLASGIGKQKLIDSVTFNYMIGETSR